MPNQGSIEGKNKNLKDSNAMKNTVALLFVLCIMLTGCQSTAPPAPQDPALLSKTNGYIFVEFPTTEYALKIKSSSTGKTFELQPYNQSAGLWLPPDTYRLHSVKGNVLGPTNEIFDLSGYPSFEVIQGGVTNLGSLINFRIGDGKVLWIQRPSKESDGRLRRWLEKNNVYLTTSEVNNWYVHSVPKAIETNIRGNGFLIDLLIKAESKALDGQLDSDLLTIEDVDVLYESLVLKSLPQTHFNELGIVHVVNDLNGNKYFPAQLGQIKKREQTGTWISLDTGYTSSVKTLDVENEMIYAGLSSGQLILSTDSGESWKEVHHFEGMTITKVHKTDRGLFVLTHNPIEKRSHVFRSDIGENTSFVELKKSEQPFSFEPMSQMVGSDLFFSLSNKDLYRLDTVSLQIEKLSFPDSLINFYVNPNGVITLMARSMFGTLYVSDKKRENWNDISFPKKGKAYFNSYDSGTAFAWGKIKEYDSEKQKWRVEADFREGCLLALVDEDDLGLFCSDNRGNIFKYKDRVWKEEFYLHRN
ncbi:MAG: hypothetical protein Alis3KO_15010 [Aliiglaciecola sp.]